MPTTLWLCWGGRGEVGGGGVGELVYAKVGHHLNTDCFKSRIERSYFEIRPFTDRCRDIGTEYMV